MESGNCPAEGEEKTDCQTNENRTQLSGLGVSTASVISAAVSPTSTSTAQSIAALATTGPKRLHVSNIPFRFREADLRQLLGVSIYY